MLSKQEIQQLSSKLLSGTISIQEMQRLEEWYNSQESDIVFWETDENEEVLKERILKEINRQRNHKPNLSYVKYFKYAAVLVAFLGMTLWFLGRENGFSDSKPQQSIVLNNVILPGTDKAVLTLEDGTEVLLEKGKLYNSRYVKSNGENIIYDNAKANSNKTAYNVLTIPTGGQFFLKLPDGTKVWLNSESRLRYPVAFEEGKSRVVELVYGEAYFDVSHSTDHRGSNFKVLHKNQEIKVLGTEFNVKAYNGESKVLTTLVKGKVEIACGSKKAVMLPNQQSSYDTDDQSLVLNEVDTYYQICWVKGLFSFENMSVEDIMVVLSRWYNVKVEYKREAIKKEEFVGVISKKQNINYVLSTIKSFGIIKNYQIKENLIILE